MEISMANPGTVVVLGGTCELGKHLAKHYADQGHHVVVTSRDSSRAQTAAKEIAWPFLTISSASMVEPSLLKTIHNVVPHSGFGSLFKGRFEHGSLRHHSDR